MCETDRQADIKVRAAQKTAEREIAVLEGEIRQCRVIIAEYKGFDERIKQHCTEQLAELERDLEAARLRAAQAAAEKAANPMGHKFHVVPPLYMRLYNNEKKERIRSKSRTNEVAPQKRESRIQQTAVASPRARAFRF